MEDRGLADLLDTVWSRLQRGVADRRHPARHPVLASIGPDGPEARTLVLRGARRDEALLELHTDAMSPKAAQIARDPRVALHVWVPKDRLQIRLRARAELHPGDPSLFASLPVQARANYGGAVPGEAPQAPPPDGELARFTLIRCTLSEIDALVLDTLHRRARFTGPDWTGRWIAP
ncbi:pyridoxamine 5'-phosphate oxidase family protein [Roseibacterium sp. SDUM158017]|uniref:pyridoxamine 5'-phosphate oxidase family protein n=1 Tax=Roseicyclus salinarum TaxID=3036773 RepID=UPI002414E241|nr:pyridoxamine 5'-phosphate oxidase family protein [Roseibacterium sp. SDUM158017]MDG4647001.1 pyridoxamine 5'-phosphate oxidase family protein [Roseibacterium sp. SDUM158017]